MPEAFKVLLRELQSLGLDVRVLDRDGNEIELKEDDEDTSFGAVERSDYRSGDDEFESAGFRLREAGEEFDDDLAQFDTDDEDLSDEDSEDEEFGDDLDSMEPSDDDMFDL